MKHQLIITLIIVSGLFRATVYCKIDLQEITYQSKNWVYQIMHRKDRVAKSVEFVSRERKCACARAHLEVTFALQPAE